MLKFELAEPVRQFDAAVQQVWNGAAALFSVEALPMCGGADGCSDKLSPVGG